MFNVNVARVAALPGHIDTQLRLQDFHWPWRRQLNWEQIFTITYHAIHVELHLSKRCFMQHQLCFKIILNSTCTKKSSRTTNNNSIKLTVQIWAEVVRYFVTIGSIAEWDTIMFKWIQKVITGDPTNTVVFLVQPCKWTSPLFTIEIEKTHDGLVWKIKQTVVVQLDKSHLMSNIQIWFKSHIEDALFRRTATDIQFTGHLVPECCHTGVIYCKK